MQIQCFRRFVCAGAVLAALTGAANADTIVTFSSGTEGWQGPVGPGGSTFIDNSDGNPAPAFRTQFNNFGITFFTNTNPNFIGDYTQAPAVTISVDSNTRLINFFGQNVSRNLILELRDYDSPPDGYPYVSVWYNLDEISASRPGWRSHSVTISDTSATELPSGWGGYGAEGPPPDFFPILPPGRTFASVLAGVDEVALTTFEPGFFYGFTDFDVALDNISIQFVPEPATGLLAALILAALRRR